MPRLTGLIPVWASRATETWLWEDISEKLADSYTNSTFDKKSGQWKVGTLL
jgi:hypothetical protein